MPTNPNIVDFLSKYGEYAVKDAEKMTGGPQVYLAFPDQLETAPTAFVQGATDKYMDVLKNAKMEQDPRKLIPDGNSYYFIRALAKAHRLYRRTRITNACLSLSDSKGMSEPAGLVDNLKQVGTVDVNPALGGGNV